MRIFWPGCRPSRRQDWPRVFGLINTMVYTHLPSNILLILVPLMPNLPLAVAVLFLRVEHFPDGRAHAAIVCMAVVPPEERSAAAGVTGIVRTIGAAISPAIAGFLIASPVTIDLLFFLAGGLKSAYDLLLFRRFIKVRPPEETTAPTRQQLSCDRSNTEKGAESV